MKAGWEVRRLSEVTTKIGSGATPRGGKNAYKADGVSLIRSLNIHDLEFRMKDLAKLDQKQADVLSNVVVEPRDVLLNITGASIARCAEVPEHVLPARVNQHVSILRPMPDLVNSRFLSYLLVSTEVKDRLLGIGEAGSTRQALTKAQLQEFPIALPPLEEQLRIVAVLDEAFEGLARARANAEANLQNARELFASFLAAEFSRSSLDWQISELNDHVKFVDYRGNTPPKRESGIRLITAKNVKMGYINREPEEYILEEAYDAWMTRGFPEIGDVLFTTEAPLANVAQLDTDETVVIGQRLITMKPDPAIVAADFLKFALMSPPMQSEIHRRGTGATVVGIKASLLKTVPLAYPMDLKIQQEIAVKCQRVYDDVVTIHTRYNSKLEDLEDLRQSLLQKAFAGELT